MRHIIARPQDVKLVEAGFKKVEDYVRDAGAVAGINFGYFSPSRNHPRASYGVGATVIGGQIIRAENPPNFDTLVVRDGRATVEKIYRFTPAFAQGIDWAIGAGPQLIRQGKAVPPAQWEGEFRYMWGPQKPQVAAGILPDGNLVLAVWENATLEEVQRDLLRLGVVDALKGDSGSSATWVEGGRRLIGWGQYVPNALVVLRSLPASDPAQPPAAPVPKPQRVVVSFFPWLAGRLICIDPGHGGKDPGAVGVTGLLEKEVNLDVALRLRRLLNRAGARVIMTRQDDTFTSLVEEVNIANRAKADIFVSVHSNKSNYPEVNGLGVFFWYSSDPGKALARKVFEQVQFLTELEAWGTGLWPCRPGTWTNFYVVRKTVMTAVLAEIGFLSNKADEALLKEVGFRQKAAEGLFYGISEFFRGR